MKIAAICWRPFQILNTINFVKNNVLNSKQSVDLFLLDHAATKKYAESLKAEDLFENVYIYRSYKLNLIGESSKMEYISDRIIKIIDTLFPSYSVRRKLTNGSPEKLDDYDVVIASGWEKFFVSLATINKKAEIIMLDDGLGSYTGDFREREMPRSYKLLNRITNKGPLSIAVKEMYVNRMELISADYVYPIRQMPALDQDVLDILNRVFDYKTPACYSGKKYIYLRTPYDSARNHWKHTEGDIVDILCQIKDKTCVRPHPAQNGKVEGFVEDLSGQIWEMVCSDNVNDDNVLISLFSTAQITPKILYNKEPVLIFLYRILCDNDFVFRMDQFVDNFSGRYANKIYVPNSLEELDAIIKGLEQ